MQNVSHRVASRNDFESRDRIALHRIASHRNDRISAESVALAKRISSAGFILEIDIARLALHRVAFAFAFAFTFLS